MWGVDQVNPESPFFMLPQEMTFGIFIHLPLQSLVQAAEVCKAWHGMALDNHLWAPIAIKKGIGITGDEEHGRVHRLVARFFSIFHKGEILGQFSPSITSSQYHPKSEMMDLYKQRTEKDGGSTQPSYRSHFAGCTYSLVVGSEVGKPILSHVFPTPVYATHLTNQLAGCLDEAGNLCVWDIETKECIYQTGDLTPSDFEILQAEDRILVAFQYIDNTYTLTDFHLLVDRIGHSDERKVFRLNGGLVGFALQGNIAAINYLEKDHDLKNTIQFLDIKKQELATFSLQMPTCTQIWWEGFQLQMFLKPKLSDKAKIATCDFTTQVSAEKTDSDVIIRRKIDEGTLSVSKRPASCLAEKKVEKARKKRRK